MSLRIPVKSQSGDYGVHLGENVLATAEALLKQLAPESRVAFIADEKAFSLWGQKLDFTQHVYVHPGGEAAKNVANATLVWEWLTKHQFTRRDLLVTFGGGVVGDLGGFVAATYHRGMPYVHVPTTLLAMVDASLGGKVSVDLPTGKNLVGAFHPPLAVLADVETLSTLSEKIYLEGVAEMVKAAVVADASLFYRIESSFPKMDISLIERSIRIKADVVSEDEFEKGRRAILNFGHTLGHALEAASGFEGLSHGEAIVLGMKVATKFSHQLGHLKTEATDRILAILSAFPKPCLRQPLSAEEVWAFLGRDKKHAQKKARWVLLNDIGKALIGQEVPDERVKREVENCLREIGP